MTSLRALAAQQNDGRVRVECDCGRVGHLPAEKVAGWKCIDCRNPGIAADPKSVDWPQLVARCERLGVPVLRVDDRGDAHLIRTTTQLRAEWE
jgi:hypothetical protein